MRRLAIVGLIALGLLGLIPGQAESISTSCNLFANINIAAAAGQQKIITGVAARVVKICSFHLYSGAQSVALIEGTGTNCATGASGMVGGATAATGWTFTANSPQVTFNNGTSAVFATAVAGDDVCLIWSGASVQISGSANYTIE